MIGVHPVLCTRRSAGSTLGNIWLYTQYDCFFTTRELMCRSNEQGQCRRTRLLYGWATSTIEPLEASPGKRHGCNRKQHGSDHASLFQRTQAIAFSTQVAVQFAPFVGLQEMTRGLTLQEFVPLHAISNFLNQNAHFLPSIYT